MAGKRDVTWVSDTIIAHLQNKLPAKLDALDTEYDDGIVLEDIPSELMFTAEKVHPPGYPMLVIVADRTDLNPFDGLSRYSIEHHFLDVAVALISRGESEEILKRRTQRTVRAIEETFLDDRTMGCSVNDVICLEKDYSSVVGDDDNQLIQEGQVTVRVETMP